MEELYLEAEERMQKAIKAVTHELAMVRSGRANPALLDRIMVEAYNTNMPLNQVATITIGDASTILIRPFDRGNLGAIEKAVQKSDLGLTPQSDGTIIRLNIPPLTQERRQEMVKMIKQMVEDGKVQLRNIRRDYIDKFRKMEKNGEISEDESRDAQKEIQDLTDSGCDDLDEVFRKKEKEIVSI
ncbi:MAG TPA: ribosome recycling factor [Firmicutes bacterium]|nr:ribosome recycling factor [Bacillota bacterium]